MRYLLTLALALITAGAALAQASYTVQKGDTIKKISEKFGCKPEALAAKNGLKTSSPLTAGKKIALPTAADSYVGAATGKVQVIKQGVSVRTAPSTESPKVAEAAKGAIAQVIGREGLWYKVKFPNGKSGYIRRDMLGIAKSTGSAPAPKATQVAIVQRGDTAERLAKRYGTTVATIQKLNPKTNWRALQIGQKIKLPVSTKSAGRPTHAPNGEKINYISTSQVIVNLSGATVRTGPSTGHGKVTVVNKGTVATVLGRSGAWYKLKFPKGTIGYIRGDLLNPYRRGDSRDTYVAARNNKAAPAAIKDPSMVLLVNRAKQLLGTDYVYGGESTRGFDCSGFVWYLYKSIEGVSLPRRASHQAGVGGSVSKDQLAPGDIVFFKTRGAARINHSGIYIGGGKFIHASSAKDEVRIDSLSSGYYSRVFAGAKRVKTTLKTGSGSKTTPLPTANGKSSNSEKKDAEPKAQTSESADAKPAKSPSASKDSSKPPATGQDAGSSGNSGGNSTGSGGGTGG
ncbi:MAG: SH3 domain-containing protein [Armatimonadetes bacterium]|nr:SH3 domain-containing protein [Armatimonadota bacterium]